MATHSSALAWSISGTGEPGGLPSMGSHRVGHDWSDLAASSRFMFLSSKSSNWWKHDSCMEDACNCIKCHSHRFPATSSVQLYNCFEWQDFQIEKSPAVTCKTTFSQTGRLISYLLKKILPAGWVLVDHSQCFSWKKRIQKFRSWVQNAGTELSVKGH